MLYYERTVSALSPGIFAMLTGQFEPRRMQYISKFRHSELYISYSKLPDFILTSQGSESANHSAIRNNIRGVEPQNMRHKYVIYVTKTFLGYKKAALKYVKPVPSHVEKHLSALILK